MRSDLRLTTGDSEVKVGVVLCGRVGKVNLPYKMSLSFNKRPQPR